MAFLSSIGPKQPYFGLKGGWLTFWITVACATDMTLFGYADTLENRLRSIADNVTDTIKVFLAV